MVALAVVPAVVGVLTSGCLLANKVAVRAVARGVPSAAPFFKKALELGRDVAVGSALDSRGGKRKGGEDGLYGGTRDTRQCDKDRLVEFLEKPENRRKAKQWAEVKGLGGVDEIRAYVDRLTPVLLRGDTLVKNHDYKKGKAEAFDALLEAGIAILVDRLGEPAVQCSCGNPLSAFEHDIADADVKFDGGNEKWPSYDSKKVAKVEPAPETAEVETYKLVNVEEPETGLAREAGTDGDEDEVLDVAPGEVPPTEGSESPSDPITEPSTEDTSSSGALPAEVPDVRGLLAEIARERLESQGFEVQILAEVTGTGEPGTIVGQTPEANSPTPADGRVTLTMEEVVTEPTDQPTDPSGTGGSTGDTGGEETGGTGADGGTTGVDGGGTDTGMSGFGGT